jgi:hypothetical protein
MSVYKVAKNNNNVNISSLDKLDGYDFSPRDKKSNIIKVTKVTLVDRKMIDRVLSLKFEKYFRRLATLALKVLEDDDSSDDSAADIVLDEAKLVKEILENRYKKFLNYEKEQLFLKKIRIIENQLQMKKIEIKKKAMYLEMLERSNTRHM